jgi:transcriptional regulator with XRE-family HTH domain
MTVTTLHERILTARSRAKHTRADIARALGVSASAVGQWENPHGTTPTAANLLALARFLNVSFDWLARGNVAVTTTIADTNAAYVLGSFAQDDFEEQFLLLLRRADEATRSLAMLLLAVNHPMRPSAGVDGNRATASTSQLHRVLNAVRR